MKKRDSHIVVDDVSKYQRKDGWGYDFYDQSRSGKKDQKLRIRAYVSAWLPGYSQDGRSAVVRFWFGPSAHGAIATYRLTRKGGHWKIDWHKLAYYA
jgi:hypothetical protein